MHRLVVYVPQDIVRSAKIYAAENDTTLRQLVEDGLTYIINGTKTPKQRAAEIARKQ